MRIRGASPPGALQHFRLRNALIVVGILLLFLSFVPPASSPAAATPARSVVHPLAQTFHPRGHLGIPGSSRTGTLRGVHPLQGGEFYTQQGMTVAQINGGNSVGVTKIIEDIKAVTSPYPIAYELNGLTDVGDWFQITLDDNWPGCSGFQELMEVWSNTQGSGPVVCDPTVTYSAGDMIELELNFTSSGNVCMDFTKLATSTTHIVCQAPPDSGGTKWVFLNTISDSNGFYTGPMTEILNQTASSCPDYTVMPELSYLYPTNFVVTQETPWSDEFDLLSGACYTSGNGLDTFSPGDMTTHYFDTASGTGYGPHWSGAQNYSIVNPSYGWRYQTDPNPITSVSGSAYPTLVSPGQPVQMNTTIAGGVTPYQPLWSLNGTSLGYQSASWTWTAPAVPGQYVFSVYGVDAQKDVAGPAPDVIVSVAGPLHTHGLLLAPGAGTIDLGQTITMSVVYSGGIPPYQFTWTGLPAGCPAPDRATLTCIPSATGTSSVSVSVQDANGSVRAAGPATIVVTPDPAVSVSASGQAFDLGQAVILTASASGGTGIYSFTWSFLPAGCTSLNGSRIRCVPTSPGGYGVYVTANDTAGFSTFGGPASFSIAADPTVSIRLNRTQIEVGESLNVTALVQGGSGTMTLSWTGLPLGCPATNRSQLTCVVSGPGLFNIGASVRDGAGFGARALYVEVRVFAVLQAQLFAQPSSVTAGATTVLSLNATGGIPNLAYHWNGLPAVCTLNPNDLTATCAGAAPGSYTVTVTVVDSTGVTRTATTTFTVLPAPPAPAGGLGGNSLFLPLLIVILLAAAVIGIAAGVRSRRRRPPAETERSADAAQPWSE
ncbi:MAG: hypothetical protein L3J87_04385 [Thermoplasmata archaeon]|nr:hypothetical protein [Thermoplasmata archaeon]